MFPRQRTHSLSLFSLALSLSRSLCSLGKKKLTLTPQQRACTLAHLVVRSHQHTGMRSVWVAHIRRKSQSDGTRQPAHRRAHAGHARTHKSQRHAGSGGEGGGEGTGRTIALSLSLSLPLALSRSLSLPLSLSPSLPSSLPPSSSLSFSRVHYPISRATKGLTSGARLSTRATGQKERASRNKKKCGGSGVNRTT